VWGWGCGGFKGGRGRGEGGGGGGAKRRWRERARPTGKTKTRRPLERPKKKNTTHQPRAQRRVVGDDAVVHDHELVRVVARVRVRVHRRRRAVRRPARVRDADVRRVALPRVDAPLGEVGLRDLLQAVDLPLGLEDDGAAARAEGGRGGGAGARGRVRVGRARGGAAARGEEGGRGRRGAAAAAAAAVAGRGAGVAVLRAARREQAALDDVDAKAGRVVAAVLEAAQALEEDVEDALEVLPDVVVVVAEDAAHGCDWRGGRVVGWPVEGGGARRRGAAGAPRPFCALSRALWCRCPPPHEGARARAGGAY